MLQSAIGFRATHAVKDKLRRYGILVLFGALVMVPLEMYFYYINYSGNRPLSFIKYFLNICFIHIPFSNRSDYPV